MKSTIRMIAGLIAVLGTSIVAAQDIKVGVTLSATGPAASLGIPERNTFPLLPQTIGGKKVSYIVLDDASDTTTAVRNSRKLISEDKVDVLVGSTVTPNSLAMIDVAAESETPMISMAASSRIVDPVDAKRRWVFKTPQNDQQMALVILGHMLASGHQDSRLHRICRRLRRRLVDAVFESRRGARSEDRRQRALSARRYIRHWAGAEAGQRQARRDFDRRLGHAGRTAAEDAEGARLRRQDLSDARRGQQ